MTAAQFYTPIYHALEKVTPLKKDCGLLCGGICCKDGEEPAGMLLFPGEEKMLQNCSFATIEESRCEYGRTGTAKILFCRGTCNRRQRPLACRIFPLVPYYKHGRLEVIMDPRGAAICPLVRSLQKQQLEPLFIKRVERVARRLLKLKDGPDYLEMLTELIDESLACSAMFQS